MFTVHAVEILHALPISNVGCDWIGIGIVKKEINKKYKVNI
jgi:hypothetical protein